MLNGIKELLREKNSFLEAAKIIYEDGSGTNIDDTIVLGDESEDTLDKNSKKDVEILDADTQSDEQDTPDGGDETPTSDVQPEDDDISNTMGDDLDTDDVVLNEPDDNSSQSSPDDLPDIIGRQTGEPANPYDDLLDATLDLRTNTLKDTIPVPPAGANNSILDEEIPSDDTDFDNSVIPNTNDVESPEPDNFMDEPLDPPDNDSLGDGQITNPTTFNADDDKDDLLDEDIDEEEPDEFSFKEAITLDGESSAEEEPASDVPDEGGDNAVTSAVKDKVAETAPDETEDIVDDDLGDFGDSDFSGGNSSKDAELMKKLSTMTKSLEDIKAVVYGGSK